MFLSEIPGLLSSQNSIHSYDAFDVLFSPPHHLETVADDFYLLMRERNKPSSIIRTTLLAHLSGPKDRDRFDD